MTSLQKNASSSSRKGFYFDDNGRKTLDQLVQKILNEPQSPIATPDTKHTFKNSDLKSRNSKIRTPSNPFKRNRKCQSNKITEWLNKDKLREHQDLTSNGITTTKNRDLKGRVKSGTPSKTQEKNAKTKLPRSRSFEEYGIVLPSYEEILEQHKKFDEHKRVLAAFDEIEHIDLELPAIKNVDSVESLIEILDCKELSYDDLQNAFYGNLTYIKDILNGNRSSDRHKKYNNQSKYKGIRKDLTYNTSMIVFTDDQKLHLLSLMEKELDPDGKQTRYFFQVLLPELCLKIFMDVHHMSKKQAVKYLDQRPVV